MTTGTILIRRDGAETSVTFANVDSLTAEQINAALAEAGVGDVVHVLTPAEQELARQSAEVREAKWRTATLEELRREDQDELREVMFDCGIGGPLDSLSNEALSRIVQALIPDSY